jgi:transcriptional regulator with XRE-family HTH domain
MMNKISQRIKEIRTGNKLNQSEFGKRLCVSQDTVSLWENSKSSPNIEFVISICRQYDVSADYLLGLED